jgi:hypothetical protein
MKAAISLALVICLLTSSLASAQQQLADTGPLHRSSALEAARLAAIQPSSRSSAAGRLRGLVNLNKGTRLTVTDRKGCTQTGYMAVRDDDVLVIVQLEGAGIPPGELAWLERVAATDAFEFGEAARGGTRVVGDGLRLTSDGIFRDSVRLVQLDKVVATMPVADVARISRIQHIGSAGIAATAAAGGVFLGLMLAVPIAYNTGSTPLVFLPIVGVPVATGMLGYKASQREVEETIYRAP